MNDPREEAVIADEIIESILSSLRQGIEDLYTRRLAPKLFRVHLHSSDFARLEGIFRELQGDAHRALDESLDSFNQSRRGSWLECFKRWFHGRSPESWPGEERVRLPFCQSRGQLQPLIKPEGGWQITFHHNEDPTGRPGEIIIDTVLFNPLSPSVAGEGVPRKSARVIYRTRQPGRASASGQPLGTRSPHPLALDSPTVREKLTQILRAKERGGDQPVFAWLEFEERGERKSCPMTRRSIMVGRGSKEIQPDVQLPPLPGISREHFQIRMQEGIFLIQDLSKFGTMVDGYPIPNPLRTATHDPNQTDLWVALPRRCRITLASVLSLEFIAEEETRTLDS